jgi:hypothetical protein
VTRALVDLGMKYSGRQQGIHLAVAIRIRNFTLLLILRHDFFCI